MKNKTFNSITIFALVIFLQTSVVYSQTNNNPDTKMKEHKHMDHKVMMDSCKMMMDKKVMPDSGNMDMDSCKTMMNNPEHKKMMKMNKKTKMENKSSMVREGVINLVSIDKNKDGKVFQDFMDWNVISDKPGICPLCGMKLQEVTLEKAKENLLNNGFKVM